MNRELIYYRLEKVKKTLKEIGFRKCRYWNPVDDLLESRGILFDKETRKIIGLKEREIKANNED